MTWTAGRGQGNHAGILWATEGRLGSTLCEMEDHGGHHYSCLIDLKSGSLEKLFNSEAMDLFQGHLQFKWRKSSKELRQRRHLKGTQLFQLKQPLQQQQSRHNAKVSKNNIKNLRSQVCQFCTTNDNRGLHLCRAEELMFSNCGVAEDSWEFLGLQGDQTSPS